MTQWFRSWHGAPTDAKWLVIARKAGSSPGVVSAIIWALLDHASQSTPRGTVSGFDAETYSEFSGFPLNVITGIIGVLTDKGCIINGTLAAWEKRQPKREDNSAERVKAWRERNVTQRNTNEHRTEQSRTDTDTDKKESSHPKRVRVLYSVEFDEFWKGYPKTPIMSKLEAWREWGKLSEDDRKSASLALPGYGAFLRSKPDHPAVHACRFLKQRRFDGFNQNNTIALTTFRGQRGSPQWMAWAKYNGRDPPTSRDEWHFPSEWPPNGSGQHGVGDAEAAEETTGAPSPG